MAYSQYQKLYSPWLLPPTRSELLRRRARLSFSVVLRNMGGQIKRFGTSYNRVPFRCADWLHAVRRRLSGIGIDHRQQSREDGASRTIHIRPTATRTFGRKTVSFPTFFRHLIFGLQYQPSDKFYIDLAYNYKTHSDMSAFSLQLSLPDSPPAPTSAHEVSASAWPTHSLSAPAPP